jgi:vitamin B12 transporter
MIHTWKAVLCFTPLWFLSAIAANEDTTKSYHVDAVVVTATRTTISQSDAPSSIQVVTSETIKRINGTTIADILRFANGVELKDYGTIGGIKNVKLRGLSTENVALLVDGHPVNNPQYGSMDLSLLPLETMDKIEVLYGGASALYGGNALGGVVNLVTRRAQDGFHGRAKVEMGSFGASRLIAEVQNRLHDIGLLVNVSKEFGDDDYPFISQRSQGDTTIYRRNADYARTQVFVSSDFQPVKNVDLYASLLYVTFERGAPGPISSPSTARQHDDVYRVLVGSKWKALETIVFTLSGIYNYNNESYIENIPFIPTDLLYKSRSYSINFETEWVPIIWDRMLGGIEYGKGWLDVKGISWASPFIMKPERGQKSAYLSNEVHIEDEAEWLDRFMFFQTIRYDGYSDVRDEAISPKFGINVRLNKSYNVHLRSSLGKNFRVPTFNDLYYPNYSNTGLAPEHSTAFDGGIIGSLEKSGRQTLEITYFDINTEEKIVTGADWRPYNIGKANNSGIELRYDYHSLDGKADVYFGLTFIDALKKNKDSATDSTFEKQLVSVPRSSGAMGVSIESEIGRITINHYITGLRYINADNTKSLPAYMVTDVNISKRIAMDNILVLLRCDVSNVFDVSYQSIFDYPMPGRTFMVSVGIEY